MSTYRNACPDCGAPGYWRGGSYWCANCARTFQLFRIQPDKVKP